MTLRPAVPVLLLLAFGVGGCSRPQSSPTAQPKNTGAARTYYLLVVGSSGPYWLDLRKGAEARAEQVGSRVIFTGPAEVDPLKQVTMLEEIVAKQPDGILISPIDAATLQGPIDRAARSGIPVITVDNDSPQSQRVCYIGTENARAGLVVGELLAKEMGGKGSVGISMIPGAWNIEERAKGVRQALARYPGIKIVGYCNDKGDPSESASAAAAMLSAHPDISGIAALAGEGGAGAARAVVEAGKKGNVRIVCFDRNDNMLPYIKDGTIAASVAQKTYLMGWLGVTLLDGLVRDEIKHLPDWRKAKAPPMPSAVDTGVMVITKGNVDQFAQQP